MTLHDALDNADNWWRDPAERALAWWAETGQPFTVDDLRDLGVPEPDHPARWGALFAGGRKQGLVHPIGYSQSRRPARHGSVIRIWKGTMTENQAA